MSKNKIKCKNSLTARSSSLILVALSMQLLPLAVQANDAAQSRQAPSTSPDSAQSGAATVIPAAEHTTLYGSARKHEKPPDAGTAETAAPSTPTDLSAVDNAAKLQSEKAAADAYALAVQKLSQGQKLSSEEYRSLDIGTIGMETDQKFFQKLGRITTVYADFPADKAGIRVGETEVDTEPDPMEERERANPTQALTQVKFNKVGAPVDVTLLRNGQQVKFTLITRNIEDIKEPKPARASTSGKLRSLSGQF
jgi:C-terminal processing protease CtpA/Prc